MATTLQVILQSDVANVGTSGELVKVRPGFARNFLLPRKLAVPATSAQINRLNHDKAVAVARAEKNKKESQELAKQIDGLKLTLARPVGEDGKLFGSVTAKEIESEVKKAGIASFDRKKMHLAEAIKAVRPCGIVSVPGVYGGPLPINMGSIVQKGLTMKSGQTHVKRYLETLTKLIQAGKFDMTSLITHRSADLADGPDLYKTFRDKKDGCVKVVFHPN